MYNLEILNYMCNSILAKIKLILFCKQEDKIFIICKIIKENFKSNVII